jgi:hypothetical protein
VNYRDEWDRASMLEESRVVLVLIMRIVELGNMCSAE